MEESRENEDEPLFEQDPLLFGADGASESDVDISCFDGEDLFQFSPTEVATEHTPMSPTVGSLVTAIMPVVFSIQTRLYGTRLEYVKIPAFDDATGEQLLSILNVETVSPPGWMADRLHIIKFKADMFSWAWVNGELQVCLPDLDVVEVNMRPYLLSSDDTVAHNVAAEFKIQNACGCWDMPTPRNLKETTKPILESSLLRRLGNKKSKKEMRGNRIQQDAVHSIAGVRSYKLMEEDFLLLLGNNSRQRMQNAGITCGIYMILLRGNIGFSLELRAINNYLLLRTIGGWGSAEVRRQENLVCDVASMQDINWDFPRWAGEHAMVKQGKTTLEISRKGGVVMRIIFRKGTMWDANNEAEVLASTALLMRGIRQIMHGVT